MRNQRWLSVALLLLFTLPSLAEKVATTPAPTGYIDDYANVLTAPAKSELGDLCNDLHTKTKVQIFVVTISTLDGESVETFANHLFAKWKIGEKRPTAASSSCWRSKTTNAGLRLSPASKAS